MKICIFEDSKVRNLSPIVYYRPVFELRCGYTRLFEKIQQTYEGAESCYLVRDFLAKVTAERFEGEVNNADALDEDTLFINGRRYYGDMDRDSLLDILDEEADRVQGRQYCGR